MLVANIKIEKPLKYQRRLGLLSSVPSQPVQSEFNDRDAK